MKGRVPKAAVLALGRLSGVPPQRVAPQPVTPVETSSSSDDEEEQWMSEEDEDDDDDEERGDPMDTEDAGGNQYYAYDERRWSQGGRRILSAATRLTLSMNTTRDSGSPSSVDSKVFSFFPKSSKHGGLTSGVVPHGDSFDTHDDDLIDDHDDDDDDEPLEEVVKEPRNVRQLRRLQVRNAPEALVELSSELVVLILKCLPVGERHAVASSALCRRHVGRVRDQRDVWLPLCASSPWRIRPTGTRGLSACELRKLHHRVLTGVDRARRGTVHDVADAMCEFADVAGVQRRCLDRLVAMLHCERVRKQALGSRVTGAVVNALRNFADDAALQAVALHCVVFLARPIGGAEGMVFSRGMASEGVDAFLRGGINGVLDAMAAHLQNPDVQAMGCWSLVNLALNRKQKLLLLEKSCLDRVLDAMVHHPSVLEVQFRALFALINLVIPEHPTDGTSDPSGSSSVTGSPIALGHGGFLHRSLVPPTTREDPWNTHQNTTQTTTQSSNVLDHVLAAMHTFYESDKLIRCGCLVLHNLSLREANIPHLLAAGVAGPLERAARSHKDTDVQRSAASTLRRLGLPLLPLA